MVHRFFQAFLLWKVRAGQGGTITTAESRTNVQGGLLSHSVSQCYNF